MATIKLRVKSTEEMHRVNNIRYELQKLEANLYLSDNDIYFHNQPQNYSLCLIDTIKQQIEEHFRLSKLERHLERLGALPAAYESIDI